MDPELLRLAQEQMSHMSPAELVKIQQQMMSNPELTRLASESMKNMMPEDLWLAAEQLKHMRPEEMAEICEKMANASPEEILAIHSQADAQMSYQLSAAEMLKEEGNRLHSQGNFYGASQNYLLAKKNLKGIPSSKGKKLLLACSLNLMLCYLKMRQYNDCITEGNEVLAYDAKNVKALYRRGQAFKELGQLEDAVLDLGEAHEVSPDDKTIAKALRDAKERLARAGRPSGARLVIEEIIEEDEALSSTGDQNPSAEEHSEEQIRETKNDDESQSNSGSMGSLSNSECLRASKDNPDAIRLFQDFISEANPKTLAETGAGNAGHASPEMLKAASKLESTMSLDEHQKIRQLASPIWRDNPFATKGSSSGSSNGSTPGSAPDVSPDILKTASEVMAKMPSKELQRILEMESSLRGKDPSIPATNSNADRPSSSSSLNLSDSEDHVLGETSSSTHRPSSLRNSIPSQLKFPSSPADLHDQMRDQMKDPTMRQMFASMVKNISPEMMANMGEQFGLKLSGEDSEKAPQAMSSLSPEDLHEMMRWADRIQRGVDTAKKTKNWLLGRPGMVLATCMLILAAILHGASHIR